MERKGMTPFMMQLCTMAPSESQLPIEVNRRAGGSYNNDFEYELDNNCEINQKSGCFWFVISVWLASVCVCVCLVSNIIGLKESVAKRKIILLIVFQLSPPASHHVNRT